MAEPLITPAPLFDPAPQLDVDAAMPAAVDLPMGWTLRDQGHLVVVSPTEQWGIAWRLLELRAAAPRGERWALVVSAHGPTFSRDAWQLADDQPAAKAALEALRTQLREASSTEPPKLTPSEP